MTIPTNIRREHVQKAAQWVDEHGDAGRPSRKYLVVVNGRQYPPKLIISKAYFFAHGSDWPHSNFHGGEETNSFLRNLGFEIVGLDPVVPGMRKLRDRPAAISSRPSGPVLDRVRHIAKSMNTRVTTIDSDGEGHGTSSLLLLHMAEGNVRDVHVFTNREGEDDTLYVLMPIEFDPPVSGYVCDSPEEEYSEFLTSLMRGRTQFSVRLEGRLLKGIDLHQVFPVPGGEDALKRVLLAAVAEILATEENVRKAVREANAAMSSSRGKRTGTSLGDSMYA